MARRRKDFKPVKRPGAATRAAKREGISLSKWEQKHKHDPGRVGREARFPLIAKEWHHRGRRRSSRGGSRR